MDVDAIERFEGAQVVAGLDEEARIFEMRRGTNYDTRLAQRDASATALQKRAPDNMGG